MLRSIKGESAGEEGQFPTEPDPRWGPESVVCGQLEALRCDCSVHSISLAAMSRIYRIIARSECMHEQGWGCREGAEVCLLAG